MRYPGPEREQNMKQNRGIKRFLALAGAMLALAALGGCGGAQAPDSVGLANAGYLFREAGETYNLAEDVILEGGEDAELVFSTSDPSVAEISGEGVLTITGEGTAKVTVAAAADEEICAAADILVCDYTGTYTAEKYVDAMGCSVRITLSLAKDGTFSYYRYPMTVNLEGGGRMEGMEDQGTYVSSGNALRFTGDFTGAFSLAFTQDGNGRLSGDTPTGGASTAMEFERNSTESQGEDGVYLGTGERESGEEIAYQLTVESGLYTLALVDPEGAETTISAGSYSFAADGMEFLAEEAGVPFHAAYDPERQAIEGTEIPVTSDSDYEVIPVTLTRQN